MSVHKRLVPLGFLVLLLSSALTLSAKDQGFSGRWTLDKKVTKVEGGPENLHQTIHQSGSTVSIDSTFAEPKNGIVPLLYLGIMITRLELSTDGSEQTAQIGPFRFVSKTTLDGNKMVTDYTADSAGKQVQGHWTRTLAADGKHMTMDIQQSGEVSGTATLQFVKK